MSVTRNYYGDRGRDRPAFNYRRNDRNYVGNVPTSRHSIFIRGFPSSVSAKHVKNFFVDESRSNVDIDFVSYTDEHKKLCIAVRFESTQTAREMFTKYNNREVLGHTVEFSWFKDMKAVKGKFNDRRFNNNNYNNRPPRRFIDRRSRSKQRYRDSGEKRRDYKSHSRSADSASSSSFSKSRSGSDSLSDRSSASPTRLIRNLNKEKYKRRHKSGDSYSSKERSKDRNETKSDTEPDRKKRKRSGSRKRSSESDKVDKSALAFDLIDKKKDSGSLIEHSSGLTDLEISKVKLKSTELLEDYSKDIEKYLSVINVLIGKNTDYELPLVASLKDILTEIGDKYVNQFVTFIGDLPSGVTAS